MRRALLLLIAGLLWPTISSAQVPAPAKRFQPHASEPIRPENQLRLHRPGPALRPNALPVWSGMSSQMQKRTLETVLQKSVGAERSLAAFKREADRLSLPPGMLIEQFSPQGRFHLLGPEMTREFENVAPYQVRPGTEVPGTGDPTSCAGCGDGPMPEGALVIVDGQKGPLCPANLCMEDAGLGCHDPNAIDKRNNLCMYPAYQELPITSLGQSGISFRRDGFKEVLLLRGANLTTTAFGRPCTAVLVAKDWALTALHCLGPNRDLLDRRFKRSEGGAFAWQKLAPRNPEIYTIQLVSTYLGASYTLDYALTPGFWDSPFAFADTGLPVHDIAVLRLTEPVTGMAESDFPFMVVDPLQRRDAISFVGFGKTALNTGITNPPWLVDLESHKFPSFNFLESSGSRSPHFAWRVDTPKGGGSPCMGDSGGGIYSGFNRGFWNSPRRLIGIVSGLEGSSMAQIGRDCLSPSRRGVGVSLRTHFSDICRLTSGRPRGCG